MDIVIQLTQNSRNDLMTDEEIKSYDDEPVVITWDSELPRRRDLVDMLVIPLLLKGKISSNGAGKGLVVPDDRIFPAELAKSGVVGKVVSVTWELNMDSVLRPVIQLELC